MIFPLQIENGEHISLIHITLSFAMNHIVYPDGVGKNSKRNREKSDRRMYDSMVLFCVMHKVAAKNAGSIIRRLTPPQTAITIVEENNDNRKQ